MNIVKFQPIIAAVLLHLTAQAAHATDSWKTHYFTNETVIANSHTVISALNSGDTQSKTRVEALVGSEVAFVGGSSWADAGTNITLVNNISVNIEWQPPQPQAYGRSPGFSNVEILGTLKKVDFEKRVIYINAKPRDFRENWTL